MNLSGKNIVFVGGCGGIGLETCRSLMRKNVANIIILDMVERKEELDEIRALNPRVALHFVSFNVTLPKPEISEVFQNILSKVPTIDVLINGVGIFNDRNVNASIDINLTGLINTTEVVYKLWDQRHGGKGGLLVNISSVAGLSPFGTVPVYSATKAGVLGFTRALAQVQPLTGVSACTICPGITKTPMMCSMPTWLDLDPRLEEKANGMAVQTAAECGANIVTTIERCQNGAVWLLDNNRIDLIDMPTHWQPPKELL